MKKNRVGVLTGGGDCAGLNPAIKWIVKTALDFRLQQERGVQFEIIGIRDGWKGLTFRGDADETTNENLWLLSEDTVRTWDRYGGTALGTSRFDPYSSKNDQSKTLINNIERLGLDALIVLGGDDTLSVADKLSKSGVNVVGVPKTIDKDLVGTDYTLGFETAMEVITEIVDKLRTTAGSHKRIFVVETMGRDAGWLALEGGESCGAFISLIPEYSFSMERVNELIAEGRCRGMRYEIIVVAEGAKAIGGSQYYKSDEMDAFGHKYLGGISQYVSNEIGKSTKLETRNIVLSHIQRGGAPCAYDRRMGRYFGIAAMNLVVNEDFGRMVSYRQGRITSVPLKDVVGRSNLVDVETLYDTERYNGRRVILS